MPASEYTKLPPRVVVEVEVDVVVLVAVVVVVEVEVDVDVEVDVAVIVDVAVEVPGDVDGVPGIGGTTIVTRASLTFPRCPITV